MREYIEVFFVSQGIQIAAQSQIQSVARRIL